MARLRSRRLWIALTRGGRLRYLFALVILAVGASLLMVDYVRLPAHGYEIGEVADRDIRAPTSFEFIDWDETLSRQRAAEDAVLPVYDYDATLSTRVQERMADAFDAARIRYNEALLAARTEGLDTPAPPVMSAIARDFVKMLELSIDTDVIDTITEQRWSRDIEDLAKEYVAVAMKSYVVSDASALPAGTDAVSVVRIFGDRRDEVQLDDFAQILTPAASRQAITLYSLESKGGTAAVTEAAVGLARAGVRPNFSYNQLLTEDRRRAARERVADVVVRVRRGTALVREGDVIKAQDVERIEALRESRAAGGTLGLVLSLVALSALFLTMVFQFAAGYIKKFSTIPRDVEAIAFLSLMVLALGRIFVELSGPLSGTLGLGTAPSSFWFLVPFAGGAMLVRILVNSETALVWALVTAALLGVMLDRQVLYTVFFAISGLTAAGGIAYTKDRVNVLRAGVITGIVNAAAALLLNLVQAQLGDLTVSSSVATQPLWDMGFAFTGGILSAIMALGLVPLFELFGFVTDYKLLELSNLNHPLLRQLMLRAPGTYHHSVTVAQLCEAAAERVGANALLTRVGCYFHDIGKAVQPRYFIENQRGGVNPHDKLPPRTSARLIINHVLDGAAIARQYKLPQPVIDGILTHHGTGLIQYFYAQALREAQPPDTVDEADFRYPGQLPTTRETGIMMLADKVEAACRTLRDRSRESIQALVQKLVNATIVDGQLELCPLTVKEIYVIVEAFTDTLEGIYHHRIEYPGVPATPKPTEASTGPIITLEITNPLRADMTDPRVREGSDPGIDAADDYESGDHLVDSGQGPVGNGGQ